jgi:uncharacterized membrane protein YgdD (TMEM256/DUF423 family)
MIRLWLAVAGLGGLASVAAGALAAHLTAEPRAAELLRTGAIYGMVHATALIAVIALAQGREPRRGAAAVAGWSFTAGIVLFSGSLFALARLGDAGRRRRFAARLDGLGEPRLAPALNTADPAPAIRAPAFAPGSILCDQPQTVKSAK